MKRSCLAALLLAFGATSTLASVPTTMNVQGRLLNAGSPMSGTHPTTFKIFDAQTGGTQVWSEDDTVSVLNGIYSQTIGMKTPLGLGVFSAQYLWLEVAVDGTALSPRIAFDTNAYAFRAQRADTADVAMSGASGNEPWATDGTNVWRPLGNVGIGTTDPGELLHLEKGSGTGASILVRSYVPGTGSFGKLQFQNVLATGAGIAAEIEAVRPVATWGQESDLLFKTNPGSPSPALTERMRITRDGNVGIGTLDTQARLFVDAPLSSVPNYGILRIGSADYSAEANNVVLSIAPGVVNVDAPGISGGRFKIDASGNVGVATTNPREKIEVYDGRILVTGSGPHDTAKLYFINTAAGGNRGWAWQALDGGDFELEEYGVANGRIMISPGGNVGIGATSPGQKLYVDGSLCATGSKNAIVQTSRGMTKVYSQESPEVWFEDFGSGQLRNGQSEISLDPIFLETVTIDAKHAMKVFVELEDDCNGVFVTKATRSFVVRELHDGKSHAKFSYRVVAKRKGYEDERFESLPPAVATKR